jgi:prepilin-type N-terminal cleavage/methylation domain-containing protein
MKDKGFTLIEIVIVLMLAGVLSAFALISLDPSRGVKLEAAARKVKADLMYTRSMALSMAKWYGISFEADPANTYSVYQTDGTSDTIIQNPAQLGEDFIISLHDYYSGVKICSVNIGGGNKIEFHPLGTPYPDRNGSPLAGVCLVTLECQGLTRTILITPNTGRIGIQ